jgi:MoaA/NifB/PqqE/SkfB family radical SAM enzyme
MDTKRVKLINVLRRLKDLASCLNEPKQMYDYIDAVMEGKSDLGRLTELMPFEPGLKNEKACLYGHFDELNDRITGEKGSFDAFTERFGKGKMVPDNAVVRIGVTRYNFFCLDEIIKTYMDIRGLDRESFKAGTLNIFPVRELIKNFIVYINRINEGIKKLNVELVLCDEALIEILQLVQFHAQRDRISEKELARLLGVISENAFIGPQTIVFDPYHKCNIKCKHCFVHNPLIHHQQEFLDRKFDLGIFKGIIDDAADLKVDGIILQGDGEPLAYDKFFDMLRYARSKDIGVLFFTNGSLIGEREAEEIVGLGIREIYCSVPAGTKETYELVTAVGTQDVFLRVINNLKYLMRVKQAEGKHCPRLTMTHVIHTLNYHELIDMARLDAEIGADAARFYLIRLDSNNNHLKLKGEELERIKSDIPTAARIFKDHGIDFVDNIKFQLDHYDNDTGAWSKDIFLEEGCMIGWYFCLIPALYDVSLCCHLRTVGYLNKQSFKELWNSRQYRRYRIMAKYLKDNKDFTFPNGVKLYDEHCNHCDNHQTLVTTLENMRTLGLYRFIK